jgi:hypothetical protein
VQRRAAEGAQRQAVALLKPFAVSDGQLTTLVGDLDATVPDTSALGRLLALGSAAIPEGLSDTLGGIGNSPGGGEGGGDDGGRQSGFLISRRGQAYAAQVHARAAARIHAAAAAAPDSGFSPPTGIGHGHAALGLSGSLSSDQLPFGGAAGSKDAGAGLLGTSHSAAGLGKRPLQHRQLHRGAAALPLSPGNLSPISHAVLGSRGRVGTGGGGVGDAGFSSRASVGGPSARRPVGGASSAAALTGRSGVAQPAVAHLSRLSVGGGVGSMTAASPLFGGLSSDLGSGVGIGGTGSVASLHHSFGDICGVGGSGAGTGMVTLHLAGHLSQDGARLLPPSDGLGASARARKRFVMRDRWSDPDADADGQTGLGGEGNVFERLHKTPITARAPEFELAAALAAEHAHDSGAWPTTRHINAVTQQIRGAGGSPGLPPAAVDAVTAEAAERQLSPAGGEEVAGPAHT